MSLFNSNYFADTGPPKPSVNKRRHSTQGGRNKKRRADWNKRMKDATTLVELENIFLEMPQDVRQRSKIYRQEKKRLDNARRSAAAPAAAQAEAKTRASDGFQLPIDDVDVFLEKERAYFNQPIDLNALKDTMMGFARVFSNDEERSFLDAHLSKDVIQSMLMTYSFVFRCGIAASKYAYEDMCHRKGVPYDEAMIDTIISKCQELPLEHRWGVERQNYGNLYDHDIVKHVKDIFQSVHTVHLSFAEKLYNEKVKEVETREAIREMYTAMKKDIHTYTKMVQHAPEPTGMKSASARFDATGPRAHTVYDANDDFQRRAAVRFAFLIGQTVFGYCYPHGQVTSVAAGLRTDQNAVLPDRYFLASVESYHAGESSTWLFRTNHTGQGQSAYATSQDLSALSNLTRNVNTTASNAFMSSYGSSERHISNMFSNFHERFSRIRENVVQMSRAARDVNNIERIGEENERLWRDASIYLNQMHQIMASVNPARLLIIYATLDLIRHYGRNLDNRLRYAGAALTIISAIVHQAITQFDNRLDNLLMAASDHGSLHDLVQNNIRLTFRELFGMLSPFSVPGRTILTRMGTGMVQLYTLNTVINRVNQRPRGIIAAISNVGLVQFWSGDNENWHKNDIRFRDDGQSESFTTRVNGGLSNVKNQLSQLRQITLPIGEVVKHENANAIVVDRFGESGVYGVPGNTTTTVPNKAAVVSTITNIGYREIDINLFDRTMNLNIQWYMQVFGSVVVGGASALLTPSYSAVVSVFTAGVVYGVSSWFDRTPLNDADMGDTHAFVLLKPEPNWALWDIVTGQIYRKSDRERPVARMQIEAILHKEQNQHGDTIQDSLVQKRKELANKIKDRIDKQKQLAEALRADEGGVANVEPDEYVTAIQTELKKLLDEETKLQNVVDNTVNSLSAERKRAAAEIRRLISFPMFIEDEFIFDFEEYEKRENGFNIVYIKKPLYGNGVVDSGNDVAGETKA